MKPLTEKEFYKKRKAVRLHRCWEKLIIWSKTNKAKQFKNELKQINH
jgi:hypothetical protein